MSWAIAILWPNGVRTIQSVSGSEAKAKELAQATKDLYPLCRVWVGEEVAQSSEQDTEV